MTSSWISLQEARDCSFGRIEWWKCRGRRGERVVEQDPTAPPGLPVRLYANGTMYLGGWKNDQPHGFGIQYRMDGYIRVWHFAEGLFCGEGMLLWLTTSGHWATNRWKGSVLVSSEGEGLPFIYVGEYRKGTRIDQSARVILKDGTTRIGPWMGGAPMGDWWEDHEQSFTSQKEIAKLLKFSILPRQDNRFGGSPCVSPMSSQSRVVKPPSSPTHPSRSRSSGSSARERRRSLSEQLDHLDGSRGSQSNRVMQSSLPMMLEIQADTPTSDDDWKDTGASEDSDSTPTTAGSLSTEEERKSLITSVVITSMGAESDLDASDHSTTKPNDDPVSLIAQWLVDDVIGHDAIMDEMRTYAQYFIADGFHSIDLIQKLCTVGDVGGWMKRGHRRLFLQRAQKYDPVVRQQQFADIAEWLTTEIIGYGADRVAMESYAQRLLDDGFHSVKMIQDVCNEGDLMGWKRAHKRLFLARVELKKSEIC